MADNRIRILLLLLVAAAATSGGFRLPQSALLRVPCGPRSAAGSQLSRREVLGL